MRVCREFVTRSVSEAALQYGFFLAYASGYEKCASSKRVSEDRLQLLLSSLTILWLGILLLALLEILDGATATVMKNVRRLVIVLIAAGIIVAIAQALRPQPVRVDVARVTRGPIRVTIDEDGKTRIKERYVVSAPLAGRLLRINKDPGDTVKGSETRLATLEPSDPQLLNPRELAAAEAREKGAEAAYKRADPALEQARADLEFAESELARQRKLRRSGATSVTDLQNAELLYRNRSEAFRAATFAARIARYELEQARAALLPARSANEGSAAYASDSAWRFEIYAPIDGRVLRVFQESSAVVTPGMPLLEVGDPTDLELEIDVLSSDAVQIHPGDEVDIEHWGGAYPLRGAVRLVEPSAFTKISALGVEEQRVNVIVDLLDVVQNRSTLGDGFRVEVRIVIWDSDEVLRVPVSALFRDGDKWLVFIARDGKAIRQLVELGHRNDLMAEVVGGLEAGEQVIVHPSDTIMDGVDIEPRDVE